MAPLHSGCCSRQSSRGTSISRMLGCLRWDPPFLPLTPPGYSSRILTLPHWCQVSTSLMIPSVFTATQPAPSPVTFYPHSAKLHLLAMTPLKPIPPGRVFKHYHGCLQHEVYPIGPFWTPSSVEILLEDLSSLVVVSLITAPASQ